LDPVGRRKQLLMTNLKACSTCGETKPFAGFGKQAGRRDGLASQCKVCRKISNDLWAKTHPEKVRAKSAAWAKAHPEKTRARHAAWMKANPGVKQAITAAWMKANPEKMRANGAAWDKANPEKVRAKCAAWRKANPEACRINGQNYEARKRENGGTLSRGLSAKLFTLQRGMCVCGCKQPLGDNYHLDHILPIKLGGGNTDDNIQLLTATCNMQKGAKHPDDFMQQRGFLL